MAARVRLHVQRSRLISNPVLFSAGDVCEALYCEADVSSSAWTRHTMAARVFMCSVAVSSLTQCSSQLVTSVKRCIVNQMLAAVRGLATRWPRASSCAA